MKSHTGRVVAQEPVPAAPVGVPPDRGICVGRLTVTDGAEDCPPSVPRPDDSEARLPDLNWLLSLSKFMI